MNIYDIAKLSGVSKSTVSRVINNEKVSETNRQKVLEVMKENNFIPNKGARSILKNKKKSIVVIVTRLDSFSENRVIRGIMQNSNNQIELMIFESQFSIEKTKEIYEAHKDADAYIIFAIGKTNYEFLNKVIAPIIFVGQKVNGFNSITFEDTRAMRLLFERIDPQNKMLYFALPDSDPTTGKARTSAIKKLCQKNNIILDIVEVKYSIDQKYELPNIENLQQYDTILCATDSIALFVYMQIKALGVHIKLGSIGNNVTINQYMQDYISISLGYKNAGIMIADMLLNSKVSSKTISAK